MIMPRLLKWIAGVLLTLLVLPSVFLWFDSLRHLPSKLLAFFTGKTEPSPPIGFPGTTVLPPVGEPLHADGRAKLLVILLACGVLLPSARVDAQVPVAAEVTVTQVVVPTGVRLEDAIARALDQNGDLEVAKEKLIEASAQRQRVFTAWQPYVKAVGTYAHNSNEQKFDMNAFIGLLPLPAGVSIPSTPPTIIQRM